MEKLDHKQMLFDALKPETILPEPVQNIYQKQTQNWREAEAALEQLVGESFDADGWRLYQIPDVEGFWTAADVLSDSNLIELLINHGSAVDRLLVEILKNRKPLENLEKIRDLLGRHLLERTEDKYR